MIPGQYVRACEVLGVSAGTFQREVREAFHRLAWEYHPDRNSAPGVQARFEEICAAYRVLTREKPPLPVRQVSRHGVYLQRVPAAGRHSETRGMSPLRWVGEPT